MVCYPTTTDKYFLLWLFTRSPPMSQDCSHLLNHKQNYSKDNSGPTTELFFEMTKSVFWRVRKSCSNKRGFSRCNKGQNPRYDRLQYSSYGWLKNEKKKNTVNRKALCVSRKRKKAIEFHKKSIKNKLQKTRHEFLQRLPQTNGLLLEITLKKWFLIKTGRRLFCGGVEEGKFFSEKFSSGQFYSTTLRCVSFSEKNIENKHLCYHDKNYCYFCKSNIPVNNLIVGSRNMIKLSKNMSL